MSGRKPNEARAHAVRRLAQLSSEVTKLERQSARRNEAIQTRRRVLVGACVLAIIEDGGTDGDELRRILSNVLPDHLTRDLDRELLHDLLGPERADDSSASA